MANCHEFCRLHFLQLAVEFLGSLSNYHIISFTLAGLCLQDRFWQRGIMSDLDETIKLQRAGLKLLPSHHSDRSMFLNKLALSLRDRFLQRGMMSDLDEAIELYRGALLLRLPGHSDRSMSLNNLALSLPDRFRRPGEIGLRTVLHKAMKTLGMKIPSE